MSQKMGQECISGKSVIAQPSGAGRRGGEKGNCIQRYLFRISNILFLVSDKCSNSWKNLKKSLGQCNIIGATSSMKKALQEYFIKARILDSIFSNRKNSKTNQEKKLIRILKASPNLLQRITYPSAGPYSEFYVYLGQWKERPCCLGLGLLQPEFQSAKLYGCKQLSALNWFCLRCNNGQHLPQGTYCLYI